MIIKDIIKKKPKVDPPWRPTPPFREFNKLVSDQSEYDRLLENIKYKEGDFVVYRTMMYVPDIFSVRYVRYIERDYDKIIAWTAGGMPCSVHSLNCGPASKQWFGSPTVKPRFDWDTGPSYRKLTDDEFAKLIDVHVLDYVKARTDEYIAEQTSVG